MKSLNILRLKNEIGSGTWKKSLGKIHQSLLYHFLQKLTNSINYNRFKYIKLNIILIINDKLF